MAGAAPASLRSAVPTVQADSAAFGNSGEVKMVFARAGETVAFPLTIDGDSLGYTYQWIRVNDRTSKDVPR